MNIPLAPVRNIAMLRATHDKFYLFSCVSAGLAQRWARHLCSSKTAPRWTNTMANPQFNTPARDTVQSGVTMATQTFQRLNDQFTQALGFNGPQAEELTRRSSQNLQAVSQASSVLMKGAQEVSHEVLGLVQTRVQKNIDGLSRLAGCRSVQDYVAVQSDLARDGL